MGRCGVDLYGAKLDVIEIWEGAKKMSGFDDLKIIDIHIERHLKFFSFEYTYLNFSRFGRKRRLLNDDFWISYNLDDKCTWGVNFFVRHYNPNVYLLDVFCKEFKKRGAVRKWINPDRLDEITYSSLADRKWEELSIKEKRRITKLSSFI